MRWSITDGVLWACVDICGSSYHCGHCGVPEFGPIHVPPQGPCQSSPKTVVTSGSNWCQVILLWFVSEFMTLAPEGYAEACSLG